jgi:hypothetical protein
MVADSDAASSYTNRAEHMRAAALRLDELERESARMRAALETIRDTHIPDQPMADDSDEAEYARKHHTGLRIIAQQALAGSGEK